MYWKDLIIMKTLHGIGHSGISTIFSSLNTVILVTVCMIINLELSLGLFVHERRGYIKSNNYFLGITE